MEVEDKVDPIREKYDNAILLEDTDVKGALNVYQQLFDESMYEVIQQKIFLYRNMYSHHQAKGF